ncbi:hypothetical protein [Pseudonocardia adelaidensis]|uniref:Uncharacterized protein n=1 Tax=Pseudonocardia adelaidensis TaxID=648754 RepID=A0ABP9P6P9_9PSEU
MQDLPVILEQYKLTIVEPAAPKTRRDDKTGQDVVVTDRQGATMFVVSLFAKLQVRAGERAPKGEEIRVTLETDPGEGFAEDARVKLINPRINAYQIENKDNGRVTSGIAFKAAGLTPAGAQAPAPAPVPSPKGEK